MDDSAKKFLDEVLKQAVKEVVNQMDEKITLENVISTTIGGTVDTAKHIGTGLMIGIFKDEDVVHVVRWNSIFAAFAMLVHPDVKATPEQVREGIRIMAEAGQRVMEMFPDLSVTLAQMAKEHGHADEVVSVEEARARLELPTDQN